MQSEWLSCSCLLLRREARLLLRIVTAALPWSSPEPFGNSWGTEPSLQPLWHGKHPAPPRSHARCLSPGRNPFIPTTYQLHLFLPSARWPHSWRTASWWRAHCSSIHPIRCYVCFWFIRLEHSSPCVLLFSPRLTPFSDLLPYRYYLRLYCWPAWNKSPSPAQLVPTPSLHYPSFPIDPSNGASAPYGSPSLVLSCGRALPECLLSPPTPS